MKILHYMLLGATIFSSLYLRSSEIRHGSPTGRPSPRGSIPLLSPTNRPSPRGSIPSFGSFRVPSNQESSKQKSDRCDVFTEEQDINATALALYDGHSVCEENKPSIIPKTLAEGINKNEKLTAQICKTLTPAEPDEIIHQKIKDHFNKFDKKIVKFLTQQTQKGNTEYLCCGSTATMAIVLNEKIHVANIGDSQALIIFKNGKHYTTKSHNMIRNKAELERVKQAQKSAGGSLYNDRIMGYLNISRSFGDVMSTKKNTDPKKPEGLTAEPDLYTFKRDNVKALVIGSVGFWQAWRQAHVKEPKSPYQLAADTVSPQIDNHTSRVISRLLCRRASIIENHDNILVMVAKINQ